MARFEPDPTKRFDSRVEDYVRSRPGYPPDILKALTGEFGLTGGHVIADVGSGTGILSELLLGNGNLVYGIEPNDQMRAAAERLLAGCPRFRSVAAVAEATTLPDSSVDWITAGQALHWFDRDAARREFSRILAPGGKVAIIWNDRRTDTPLLRDYEQMLHDCAVDYDKVTHRSIDDAAVRTFFGGNPVARRRFENRQVFDWEGLRGRFLSSSFAPLPDHPGHEAAMDRLRAIFDQHQVHGTVPFDYDTRLYVGQLS
jgi:SAM-dependent methyltransferase